MQRIQEADINQHSVHFAGEYVETKFKGGTIVEKQLVLNTLAHGFYMGARRFEEVSNFSRGYRTFLRMIGRGLPSEPQSDEEWLDEEGIAAAKFYINKKGFHNLSQPELALIKATLGVGFKNGFKYRAALS